MSDSILEKVERYYASRLAEFGATARGVDWNSAESQALRFAQLLKVCDPHGGHFTINDYGCGYGALVPVLIAGGYDVSYRGFDVSSAMVEHARREHEQRPSIMFLDEERQLERADYTVASGIFNVKLDIAVDDWERYVHECLDTLARLSSRGFAFNMLTSYSDADRMRDDLYYGDPRSYFDWCKRQYSRSVALLHDYGLYEFTMIVRLDA